MIKGFILLFITVGISLVIGSEFIVNGSLTGLAYYSVIAFLVIAMLIGVVASILVMKKYLWHKPSKIRQNYGTKDLNVMSFSKKQHSKKSIHFDKM